ncbi:YqiA/YcfP family alpha/beta fold hydrolase [Oscillatoria acuminata]|uniref:Putative esterase n=1 Tax=Oscillatoria acuminata PCC 6304 TaxID=56110 RepID=K9TKM9_9CYAN|nr:YqiA/YcfP family alpha/beta fold hydrolase [Oscillatoria acuminata]AFY82953.1 putative esterase [Oscillatoria acuminata PCC 6304]
MIQTLPQTYIYLHGFASSPDSFKANYLRDRFAELAIPLKIPNLNQGDFSHLTLTRQLEQVAKEFPPENAKVTLIGSSFGGLTSAWLAQRYPQVDRLVLLAPAFEFLSHWMASLGPQRLELWQKEGYLPIYHYGEKREIPLSYQFITDAQGYVENQLQRQLPILILHGVKDEVIPVEASRRFVVSRPWVKRVELDSDHGLGNVMPEIWEAIQGFCGI